MSMKYAILVGDGMADFPIPELGGKTPLAYAATPNMDRVAAKGRVGLVATVPQGLPPGSDVANLSLMGYDAALYYQGRAPIEAASMGIALKPADTAFRCNLVTIEDGRMADYSAGHIETEEARELLALLGKALDDAGTRFYPGVSYRHLLVLGDFPDSRQCTTTPPHDISGKTVAAHLPAGAGSDRLRSLMERARAVLANAAANRRRAAHGKPSATDIWLWGQGRAITLPRLTERYGLSGSVISAVDLVRGLGVLAGLKVRIVDGATGYLGTNYAGRSPRQRRRWPTRRSSTCISKRPTRPRMRVRWKRKSRPSRSSTRISWGPMLDYQEVVGNLRLLVAPDHATPISLKTPMEGRCPLPCAGRALLPAERRAYSEENARGKPICSGPELFDALINGSARTISHGHWFHRKAARRHFRYCRHQYRVLSPRYGCATHRAFSRKASAPASIFCPISIPFSPA